jgi:hypothetical protein
MIGRKTTTGARIAVSDSTKRRVPKAKSARALATLKTASNPKPQTSAPAVESTYAMASRVGYSGSKSQPFSHQIVRQTASNIRMLGPQEADEKKAREKLLEITCTALAAFKPQDEIEDMLAAQAVALHFGAMEALRLSMIRDQPFEIAARLRKDGANLSRAFCDMLDALDRKRGKAQQVVRVERVVVEDGGQAIVGTVNGAPKVERG